MTDVDEETVKAWAEANNFDEDDLAHFTGSLQIGQLILQTFASEEMEGEMQRATDEVYRALYDASSIDREEDELPEPYSRYLSSLALSHPPEWHESREDN